MVQPRPPLINYGNLKTKGKHIKTAEIRESFLSFFQKNDHQLVPSSPVIPYDDPTLLFVNAGMNQFKDVFTGKEKSDYKRATSSQKCIRAGGKHNDLDNVGFTARHHTFFEMLGNFSFGDYFKEAAIEYAWEWVTKGLQLPIDKLYVSVYEDDDEAFGLWEKIAPELKNGRIMRFGKKDNYWAMGPTGPCGPCSEIHIDRGEKYGVGPEHVVNGETDRFTEFWNLVFMQFDQQPDGTIVDLPRPSVDTGAGLERLASILQGVDTNYGIDLFKNLIAAISETAGTKYEDAVASHHVVADHLRSLTFAIADGAGISNEGQGYVLRRILRRAARHGRLLGVEEPFIYMLVPVLVDEMGAAFPEIKEKQSHVEKIIRTEEEAFGRTLETGLELFDRVAKKVKASGSKVVPGEDVFRLYDTYGFPFDLTEIIAGEQELSLDKAGFDTAMERQKEQSKAGASFATGQSEDQQKMIESLEKEGLNSKPATEFVRDSFSVESSLVAGTLDRFPKVAIVLDRSPFYVESGGQIGDVGTLKGPGWEIEVTALENHQDHYIHFGKATTGRADDFQLGQKVTAEVASTRRTDIMRNHTVTHLAHAALRQVLGTHIKQSGSYVGPDRMRFDFSHHQPMTAEEISRVEAIVNEQILLGTGVTTEVMDVDDAKKAGAMALFGEKYGDKVRVVSIGDFSMELCGGTHVTDVSQIGPMFVTLETGIASGVRRLEAITGREAVKYMLEAKQFRSEVAQVVNRPETEALDGVKQLRENASSLQKEIKKVKAEMFAGGSASVGQEKKVGELSLAFHEFGDTDRDTMSSWVDSQKERNEPLVALAIGNVNGKTTAVIAGSGTAVKSHDLHAGKLAKELFGAFGGRGGGKPNFAQGSVAEGTDIAAMVEKLESLIG